MQNLNMLLLNLLTKLFNLFKDNHLIQTFLFGSIGGSIFYFVSLSGTFLKQKIYSIFRSDITITNTDPNYGAVVDYITEKFLDSASGAKSCMQVTTRKKKKTWKDYRNDFMGLGKNEIPTLDVRPNNDSSIHTFFYKGTQITFYRKKGETVTVGWQRTPLVMEEITLSMWGRNNTPIIELLIESIKTATEKEDEGITIYVQSNSWCGGFEKAFSKQPRSCESVILDVDHADSLIEDARLFLSKSKWYNEMGIPYRRGYLLYGPPGCGKTSFALVLASELKLNICILNLSQEGLNDNSLAETLRDAPSNAIVLLEDVDSVFIERASSKPSSTTVSFSGLLNAIDGIAAQEGKIFFMTTNHIERLDPALIRPGRCDILLEVKRASKLQLQKMFLRFFPGEDENSIKFMNRLPADEFSMAQLQGHFLEFSHSSALCIENTPKLLNSSKPKKISELSTYDHLKRVGLEMYASAIEFLGVYTEKDFANISLDQLVSICPDLTLDIEAILKIEKLIKKDESFFKENYALAEISLIRESFLAAYPTVYEVKHGERDSHFRRSSSKEGGGASSKSPKVNCISSIESSVQFSNDSNDYNLDINEYLSLFSEGKLVYGEFWKTSSVNSIILDKLSREFTDCLSMGGKSKISIYQLNKLLEAYPDRPIQCVLASRNFFRERSKETYSIKNMTTFSFLKRLCCIEDVNVIESKAKHISDLFILTQNGKEELKLNVSDTVKKVLKKCDKNNYPIELISFQLISKKRILWEFISHYSNVPDDNNFDSSFGALDQRMPKIKTDLNLSLNHNRPNLEEQGFAFASKICDLNGISYISLAELLHFFKQEENNTPDKAVSNAEKLLSDPPRPEKPVPQPPKPHTEWVYEWLATKFDTDLVDKFGEAFVGQGLCDKADLQYGSLLTENYLKEMGVEKVGHIRKIIHMHSELIKQIS